MHDLCWSEAAKRLRPLVIMKVGYNILFRKWRNIQISKLNSLPYKDHIALAYLWYHRPKNYKFQK